MKMNPNDNPDAVDRNASHVLFVEGVESSIDATTMKVLFEDDIIDIQPLGSCPYMESVAIALSEYHKDYYYLIDRDHRSENVVSATWKKFPDPKQNNLLIWKRRHIENYFISPNYLCESKYLMKSKKELEKEILKIANRRLFLDIANYTIISIREELKANWIEKFKNPTQFPDQEKTLNKLLSCKEFKNKSSDVKNNLSEDEITKRFNEYHKLFSKGKDKVEIGKGDWINLMEGKAIFNEIINSNLFSVTADRTKIILQGKEKKDEIVKELLTKDDDILPPDFVKLRELVRKIMQT